MQILYAMAGVALVPLAVAVIHYLTRPRCRECETGRMLVQLDVEGIEGSCCSECGAWDFREAI